MLLALDTSTPITSAALMHADGTLVAEVSASAGAGHCAELTPLLERLLAAAACDWSAVRAVAVAIGPGAFTGIRVGMAAAKGIAQARAIPLIGVPTPAMLAYAARVQMAPDVTHLVPIIDARRSELYWCVMPCAEWTAWTARYDAAQWDASVRVTAPTECAQSIAAATAAGARCGVVGAEALRALEWNGAAFTPVVTSAATVAALAVPRWQSGAVDDLLTLVPLYARPSYAG